MDHDPDFFPQIPIFCWSDPDFSFQLSGRSVIFVYKYIDGDVLQFNPGGAHAHFIVRDFFRSGGAWLHQLVLNRPT